MSGNNGGSYGVQVHQATGMVAAQAHCSVTAALALIVKHAAEHERSVDDTAEDVVEHRLRFDVLPNATS